MSLPLRTPLLTAALIFSIAAIQPALAQDQDYLEPGTLIDQSLGLDITEAGFDSMLGMALDFLPPDLTIGSIPPQEIADLFFCSQDLALDNLVLHTDVQSVSIEATSTGLVLQMALDLWINTSSDPAVVSFDGCIDYVCLLHTDPANIQIQFPIAMALATDPNSGEDFIDVTLGEFSHNIEAAMQNTVHMTDCALSLIHI